MNVISRRSFIGQGAAALLATKTLAACAAGGSLSRGVLPIGLQLYTVQHELDNDLAGALQKIASIGYREVELPPLLKYRASEMKSALDQAGLACPSVGFAGTELQTRLDECIEYTLKVGAQFMICMGPWVADEKERLQPEQDMLAAYSKFFASFTLEDWKSNAEFLNKIGERAKAAGLQFGYHNHSMEFRAYGAVVAYDVLLEATDPALVTLELDCGWAAHAGRDPAALLTQHAGRYRLLHIKDIQRNSKPSTDIYIRTTEVGSGAIDWTGVLRAAKKTGVQHCFVEQERPFRIPPLEAIRVSYEYLRGVEI